MRLFNWVKGEPRPELPTVQYGGMPPELTGDQNLREVLPWPRILLIEEKPDGIFLYRFAQDESYGGDTWHMSLEEAKEQAEYEYGESLGEWRDVPENVKDPVTFALHQSF